MKKQSILKNQACSLKRHEIVIGKWNKNKYIIERQLGYGATGNVYLAKSKHGLVALKIAPNTMSISSEVNILRQFRKENKVQGPRLGPYFYEADDYVSSNGVFPFYVMEYIEGDAFLPFVRNRGIEWLGILLIQLLQDLHYIHQAGFVFGDLKPENLLVEKSSKKLRWLDPGGMTRQGRSIKEYTEFFDRGYWGLGSRRAEPSYDLFSISMIILNLGYLTRFEKGKITKVNDLLDKFREKKQLLPYERVFLKGIEGKYSSALQMRNDVMDVVLHSHFSKRENERNYSRKKQKKNRSKKWLGVMESIVVATFLLLIYILYLFGHTF